MKRSTKSLIGAAIFLVVCGGYTYYGYQQEVAKVHTKKAEGLLDQSVATLSKNLKEATSCDLAWKIKEKQSSFASNAVTTQVVLTTKMGDDVLLTYKVDLIKVNDGWYYDAKFTDAEKGDTMIRNVYRNRQQYCMNQILGMKL